MSTTEQQVATDEQNPLAEIKNRNATAIEEMNNVLSETLGHKFGRMMSTGFGIFIEYILYAVALAVFLFIFIMEKVSPFYILAQMRENETVQDALNPYIISNFTFVVQVMIGLIALFILTTALALRRSRRTRSNMQDAIIALRDVRDDLKENDKDLAALDEVSNKMLAAATVVANETETENNKSLPE